MWMWSDEHEKAWQNLKKLVSSEPMLKFFDPTKPIQQLYGEKMFPVAYASRSITDCESRYATIELETLGMTFACENFSSIYTDSNSK